MRFINYISERKLGDVDTKDIDKIIKDTKPWFDYCKKQNVKNKFLWRGTNYIIYTIKKFKVRKNRVPTDTCIEVHDLSDKYFKKLFGIKARSETVFCFSGKLAAEGYGSHPYIIIPIGKFDFIWSKNIDDFYGAIQYEPMYKIICDSDSIDLEYEYESEYGENGIGTWIYKGWDTKEQIDDDAIKKVIKKLKSEGYLDRFDDNLRQVDKIQILADEIADDLEWVPKIDINEWIESILSDSKKQLYNTIKNNYVKNKYFKDLMDIDEYNSYEIMLRCNEYYMINEDWFNVVMNGI